jgi:hypothetical protein
MRVLKVEGPAHQWRMSQALITPEELGNSTAIHPSLPLIRGRSDGTAEDNLARTSRRTIGYGNRPYGKVLRLRHRSVLLGPLNQSFIT